MNKIICIFVVIAAISLISGGFAFMLNDNHVDDVNTNAIAKTNSLENTIDEISDSGDSLLVSDKLISDVSDKLVQNSKIVPEVTKKNTDSNLLNFEYYKLPGTNLHLRADIDYTDRYALCGECGKLIILGEITKKLPDEIKYCNGSEIYFGSIDDQRSYSYDSIVKYMEDQEKSKNVEVHYPDPDEEIFHTLTINGTDYLAVDKNYKMPNFG